MCDNAMLPIYKDKLEDMDVLPLPSKARHFQRAPITHISNPGICTRWEKLFVLIPYASYYKLGHLALFKYPPRKKFLKSVHIVQADLSLTSYRDKLVEMIAGWNVKLVQFLFPEETSLQWAWLFYGDWIVYLPNDRFHVSSNGLILSICSHTGSNWMVFHQCDCFHVSSNGLILSI